MKKRKKHHKNRCLVLKKDQRVEISQRQVQLQRNPAFKS